MDNENNINAIMEKTAAYVKTSKLELAQKTAQLVKVASEKKAFDLQTQRTAAILADRGFLKKEKVNSFVDKVAESPVEALLYLEKLAKLIEANSLGGPSEIKMADAQNVDPFEAEFFPELVYSSNGLVD